MPWELEAILGAEMTRLGLGRLDLLRRIGKELHGGPKSGFAKVAVLESSLYMRNQLLRDSDVMSMAWSLELRVPFVDARLIETLARIPADLRLRPRKVLLTEAVPELPEWVTARPKRGFVFPFEDWISEDWRDLFVRLDGASPVRLQTWYRRWCLLALESFLDANNIQTRRLGGALHGYHP
jgi:asparagine synthetase B (glutamine-hydrolysing)